MRSFLALLAIGLAGCTTTTYPPSSDWQPAATPDWAHQNRFAITDNLSDWISVIRPAAQPALLANVPVGDVPVELEGPHHLAASPDGKYVYYNLSNYVPGTGSGPHGSHGTGAVPGSLVKLDAATMTKISEVLIDRSPGDVVLSADGRWAFVSHYDLLRVQQVLASGGTREQAYSDVAVVDTTGDMTRVAMIPVCITAHGEGLSADGKTLYVTCAQSDQLAVVDVSDPTKPSVSALVPVGPDANINLGQNGFYGPYALTVGPDGLVWISDNNSGDVRVYDPVAKQMTSKVVFTGGVAMFGSFSNDGKTYYVPHQGDDQVTIIDVATLATKTLPPPAGSCVNMHVLKLAPDGNSGVLICEGVHGVSDGTALMLAIEPGTAAFTGFVTIGMFPDGAAWLPPAP